VGANVCRTAVANHHQRFNFVRGHHSHGIRSHVRRRERHATIFGYPYDSSFIDLDDSQDGADAKPVVFGDLYSAYEIHDLLGINAVRDDLSRKKEALTE
jgi:hypothetical protein